MHSKLESGFLSVKLSKNEFLGQQNVTDVCQNRPFSDLLLDLFFASVIKDCKDEATVLTLLFFIFSSFPPLCQYLFRSVTSCSPSTDTAAVVAQPPATTPTQAASATWHSTNVTKILEKAGHFTIFIRLLRSTQEESHLFSALNDSSSGVTIFAPTDSAFSELKSGTLNTLSDGDKSELVKFHVVPTFLSTSQFQTVSNPLGTWAGTGSRLPLNVTSYPNSVNITTGLTNTSLSGTVYTDNQLAIYKIEKVLLPKDIFASKAPAPAPVAPAPEKPTKAVPAATVESPVAPVDISSALMFAHNNVVGSVGMVAAAMFAL
uniref:Fasciclin-like AGP 4 n=1 Tax=Populus alba TaxID=43335 RepID=A0A4V6A496_POPAL|nr:fasciclin-like AGP 4 [Populus alba]